MNNVNIKKKLEEIAASIVQHWSEYKPKTDIGLYTGAFGMLMFLSYYNRYFGKNEHQHITVEIFEYYCEQICNGIYYAPFCGGVSGILYGLHHLREYGFIDIDLTEAHKGYSAFLASNIISYATSNGFVFMHEATGIAIYLLQYGYPSDLGLVSDYVKLLDSAAEHGDGTVKWVSDMNPDRKMIYNIAMSHGMSSISIFLSQCVVKNIEPQISKKLLTGVVQYILQQEIDCEKYGSFFPFTSLDSDKPIKSRMAWCYGDLGVATAVWKAGIALNNNQWKGKAIEVMEYAIGRRDLESNMIRDAEICHGTAGIAQFFRRMYYNTGDDKFLSANEFWINETLKMAKWKEEGTSGFKTWEGDEWINNYSFLTGVAGIGLALIASQGDELFSAWDRIILLS
jgi:lantibiotic modifying enzyme